MFKYKENHSFYWTRNARGTLKTIYTTDRHTAIKKLKLNNVKPQWAEGYEGHKEIATMHLEGVVTKKEPYILVNETTPLLSCEHLSDAPPDVRRYFETRKHH